MRILSRYVLGQWLRVFLLTAIGLPFVSVLTQLTDNLRRLLGRDLSAGTIALSYLFALPQNIATMMPAAALFAAVFTVGPLARHSELTAAKAGGISFRRIFAFSSSRRSSVSASGQWLGFCRPGEPRIQISPVH